MKKIMLIDDDVDRLGTMIEMLKIETGYEVEVFESVQRALGVFERQSSDYSAVVLDIQMPRGPLSREATDHGRRTGVAVAERIRSVSADIPIVVATVVRDEKMEKNLQKMGVNEILIKPYGINDLIAVGKALSFRAYCFGSRPWIARIQISHY